jgi:dATP pyrophosphohydrolase
LRQPVQVLVIPFRQVDGAIEYCLMKRSDANYWQFVAGGAEGDETPLEAARREAHEEAGLPLDAEVIALDSMCCVPANIFRDWKQWPEGTYVVKEFAFAVRVVGAEIELSGEHTESQWVSFDEAMKMVKWDSNRTALWEISDRLQQT